MNLCKIYGPNYKYFLICDHESHNRLDNIIVYVYISALNRDGELKFGVCLVYKLL